MFAQLKNRYCWTGKLEFTSAVHVGSGSQEKISDMPMLVDVDGKPFIPGSSLRGVMRSLVERTLAALAPGRTCLLFDTSSHPDCPTVNTDAAEKIRKTMEEPRGVDTAFSLLTAARPAPGRLCDTCRLFGSPFLASKLKIFDLRVTGSWNQSIRHGVGIDRDTGRARDGVKYDYEVVEMQDAGLTFKLEMMGENLDPNDFALLAIAWKQMDRALTVGGKSACGLGRCRPVLESVRYFDTPAALKNFLLADGDGYLTKTGPQMIGDWNGQLKRYVQEFAHA